MENTQETRDSNPITPTIRRVTATKQRHQDDDWRRKGKIIIEENRAIYWDCIYNCYFFNPSVNFKNLLLLFTGIDISLMNLNLPESENTWPAKDEFKNKFQSILNENDILSSYILENTYITFQSVNSYINLVFKFIDKNEETNATGKPRKTFQLNIHICNKFDSKQHKDFINCNENINENDIIEYAKTKLKFFCDMLLSNEAQRNFKEVNRVFNLNGNSKVLIIDPEAVSLLFVFLVKRL